MKYIKYLFVGVLVFILFLGTKNAGMAKPNVCYDLNINYENIIKNKDTQGNIISGGKYHISTGIMSIDEVQELAAENPISLLIYDAFLFFDSFEYKFYDSNKVVKEIFTLDELMEFEKEMMNTDNLEELERLEEEMFGNYPYISLDLTLDMNSFVSKINLESIINTIVGDPDSFDLNISPCTDGDLFDWDKIEFFVPEVDDSVDVPFDLEEMEELFNETFESLIIEQIEAPKGFALNSSQFHFTNSNLKLKIVDNLSLLDEVEGVEELDNLFVRAMLYIESNAEITNFKIDTKTDGNGEISFKEENGKIKLEINSNEGFVLGELKVSDTDGNNIEVKDNEFVMPDKDVIIEAKFKEVKSPNTSSISMIGYIIFMILAVFVSIVFIKRGRKVRYQ